MEAQVWFHAELEFPLNHTGSRSLRSETGKQSPKDLGVLRQVTTLKARLMGWAPGVGGGRANGGGAAHPDFPVSCAFQTCQQDRQMALASA